MTTTVLVNPELADAPCSVAECFETAATMASATVGIDPLTGTPPAVGTLTFGLPLCTDHAHLLHQGCTLLDFHHGL